MKFKARDRVKFDEKEGIVKKYLGKNRYGRECYLIEERFLSSKKVKGWEVKEKDELVFNHRFPEGSILQDEFQNLMVVQETKKDKYKLFKGNGNRLESVREVDNHCIELAHYNKSLDCILFGDKMTDTDYNRVAKIVKKFRKEVLS